MLSSAARFCLSRRIQAGAGRSRRISLVLAFASRTVRPCSAVPSGRYVLLSQSGPPAPCKAAIPPSLCLWSSRSGGMSTDDTSGLDYAAAHRVQHKAGGFMDIELLHEPRTVRLGRLRADTEDGGELLRGFPLGD